MKDEIDELKSLNRETVVPPDLEDRVVAALRERNLLRNRMRSKWWNAAAAILLLGAGFAAGYATPHSQPAQYTHVLLLREDPATFHATAPEVSLVREYSNWARDTAKSGTPIDGEKLAANASLLQRVNGNVQIQNMQQESAGTIAGFFLLQANSEEEALQKALGCPHLRYGGAIELREIDRDNH